jgi:hypothetical protein
VNWMHLAQDMDHWLALVTMVPSGGIKGKKFLD